MTKDHAYCVKAQPTGWHPAVSFKGEAYTWATSYPSPQGAIDAGKALLQSAQQLGMVA